MVQTINARRYDVIVFFSAYMRPVRLLDASNFHDFQTVGLTLRKILLAELLYTWTLSLASGQWTIMSKNKTL